MEADRDVRQDPPRVVKATEREKDLAQTQT